jgi:hypothetical protein
LDWPWQTDAVDAVNAPGCPGVALTVTETVRAALVPQLFDAVTLRSPEVAVAEYETVTELPLPLIVAPVPE